MPTAHPSGIASLRLVNLASLLPSMATCRGEQAHLAAQLGEVSAHFAERRTIVLAEIGDRLVIGHEAPQKPQKLEIARGLTREGGGRPKPLASNNRLVASATPQG